MMATSLDSEDELRSKYWTSVGHLEKLRELGCTLLHGINVNEMHQHGALKTMKFDRIVFNFPHAGHISSISETRWVMIKRHQNLLRAFFKSAREMVTVTGEVHVSHRNDHPYKERELEKLAKDAGLVLIEMVEFRMVDYPGYVNRRGGGIARSDEISPLGEPFTFEFPLPKGLQTEVVAAH